MNIINRKRNLYKFRRITKKKRLHSKKGDKIENKFETNIKTKYITISYLHLSLTP
jgi:hypothetical protein